MPVTETAFQADAFQNDAFQIVVILVEAEDSPSYALPYFTDLISRNVRFATQGSAKAVADDGGPTTGATRFTNKSSGSRRPDGGGTARPRRFGGWRRQPPD